MSGWTDALDGQERFNLRTENKELKAKLKAMEEKLATPVVATEPVEVADGCEHEDDYDSDCIFCLREEVDSLEDDIQSMKEELQEKKTDLEEAEEYLAEAKAAAANAYDDLMSLRDHFNWEDDEDHPDVVKNVLKTLDEEDASIAEYKQAVVSNGRTSMLLKVAKRISMLKNNYSSPEIVGDIALTVERWAHGDEPF